MVRYNLIQQNSTNSPVKLEFAPINLTSPLLDAKSVFVSRFSIPTGGIPLLTWNNTAYQIRLSFNGFQVIQPIVLQDRGTGLDVYDMQHLTSSIDNAFIAAVTALNILIPLPSLVPPRITFTQSKFFTIIALTAAYDSAIPLPITIDVNEAMYRILQSMSFDSQFLPWRRMIFYNTPENVYLTNFLINSQVSTSVSVFINLQQIFLSTSLPIIFEKLTFVKGSSNVTQTSILTNFVPDYVNGLSAWLTSLIFVVPADPYRLCPMSRQPITNFSIHVTYMNSVGEQKDILLPPHSVASLLLDFDV